MALNLEKKRSRVELKINTSKTKVLSTTGHRALPSGLIGRVLKRSMLLVMFSDRGTQLDVTRSNVVML